MNALNREQSILVRLMEECAEVQQRASKLLLFGADEVQPGQDKTNRERLQGEIDDLVAVIMIAGYSLPTDGDIDRKREKVEKYLGYQASIGMLRDAQPGIGQAWLLAADMKPAEGQAVWVRPWGKEKRVAVWTFNTWVAASWKGLKFETPHDPKDFEIIENVVSWAWIQ